MKEKIQNLNMNHLAAVFLASMLGSLCITTMLHLATQPGVPLSVSARVLLTAVGVILYAVIVWSTFYFIVPEYRPALRSIVRK